MEYLIGYLAISIFGGMAIAWSLGRLSDMSSDPNKDQE